MSEQNQVPGVEPIDSDFHSGDEGGLRAPPGLGFGGKTWWWFHILILVNLARLRFVLILLAIGLVIVKWDWLTARYEKWTRSSAGETAVSSDFEYFCPMHPTVVRDNAKDQCPICFMPLSKRKKGEGKDEALPAGIVSRVQLSPYRVVLAGIKTWKVDYLPLNKEIATVGYVEFNEREMKQVAARVKGRLDKLFVNQTGEMVHAGDELASLYSPELVVTVQNLLQAKRTNSTEDFRNSRERLQLWGISDDQINEIVTTGKANTHLKIRSPINGHVIKKYVREGQYVDEGMPLYDLADLSTVWIQAQVYEEEMAFFQGEHSFQKDQRPKEGLPVFATTVAFPNKIFHGNLSFVHPHVDQETRTLTVRFELNNPDHQLRPGTSATVTMKLPPKRLPILFRTISEDWTKHATVATAVQDLWGTGGTIQPMPMETLVQEAGRFALLNRGLVLAVPESAVIDTGTQRIVYREESPAVFEGVQVELGPRMTGSDWVTYYPVLGGLEAGDRVATAGSFLIDAETRLNPAAGSIYFGGTGSTKGNQSSGSPIRPSTPEDVGSKIKANLAKLPTDADKRLARLQEFCPVLKDSRLGSMGVPVKVTIEDRPVFLCCKTCTKDALANPKETLALAVKLQQRKRSSGN
jgi:membrane fusion protein, copper/silver efflux system